LTLISRKNGKLRALHLNHAINLKLKIYVDSSARFVLVFTMLVISLVFFLVISFYGSCRVGFSSLSCTSNFSQEIEALRHTIPSGNFPALLPAPPYAFQTTFGNFSLLLNQEPSPETDHGCREKLNLTHRG
jgi:hypothetical protein